MDNLRQQVTALRSRRDLASRMVETEETALAEAREHLATAEEAQSLIQTVAQTVQQIAHQQIASVVTRCLKTVFGEEGYDFHIEFERKRGKTEARLLFLKDGNEVSPTGASGGGAVDVAAFALRLAALVLVRPKRRRLLVLDEPLKWLNGSTYQERVGELLEMLAKEMGL